MPVKFSRESADASVPDVRRQFCWAHLLRDFQAMIDRRGASEPIGQRLQDSGRKLIRHWYRLHRGEIVRSTFEAVIAGCGPSFSRPCSPVPSAAMIAQRKHAAG